MCRTKHGTLLFRRVRGILARDELYREFGELALLHFRRGVIHGTYAHRILREGNHLPDRLLAGHEHDKPIQARCDPAVRRRPVLERLEQESESTLGLLLRETDNIEDPPLQSRVVNSD